MIVTKEENSNFQPDYLNKNRISGVPQFLPPAGRKEQLHLRPAALGQGHLEGPLLGKGELAQHPALLGPGVVQQLQQLVGGGTVDASQWKTWTLALQDVVEGAVGGHAGAHLNKGLRGEFE